MEYDPLVPYKITVWDSFPFSFFFFNYFPVWDSVLLIELQALDTPHPLLELGGELFKGEYQDILGTYAIFKTSSSFFCFPLKNRCPFFFSLLIAALGESNRFQRRGSWVWVSVSHQQGHQVHPDHPRTKGNSLSILLFFFLLPSFFLLLFPFLFPFL